MTFLCHPSSLTTSLWLLHSNSGTGLEKNFGFCPMFLSALSVCDCVKGKKTISFKSVYLLLLNWQTFANYIQCNPSKRKNLLRDSCLFFGHILHLFFQSKSHQRHQNELIQGLTVNELPLTQLLDAWRITPLFLVIKMICVSRPNTLKHGSPTFSPVFLYRKTIWVAMKETLETILWCHWTMYLKNRMVPIKCETH